MNQIEERLRQDLPALADALIDADAGSSVTRRAGPGVSLSADHDAPRRPRWTAIAAIAAAVVVLAGGLITISALRAPVDETESGPADGASVPTTFGTWSSIADAPIDVRPFAVSAWTGDEAVFWAGSSLSRGFAFSDGAAYDPATDSWRKLAVPGWGHPGLTSTFFDGQMYALAKGGGTRFDPMTGTWTNLPRVENMYLAATVATDSAVWGIGPAGTDLVGQPDLAVARYEPTTDTWSYGPVFEGTAEQAPIVAGLSRLESHAIWTGSEIVIWHGDAGGIAFDPATEEWRAIPSPLSPVGSVRDSRITMTPVGLVAVVDVEGAQGSNVGLALHDGVGWRWVDAGIPIARFDTVTVAAAGEWIVLFSADESPAPVHVPTGTWARDDDGPLAGLEGPNTVWTGEALIVWGGHASPTETVTDPPDGARWTPPSI